MTPHKYLAIDPGYTTGYACFNDKGDATAFDQITDPDDFMDWLENLEPRPSVIILEDYIIRKSISHSGSRAPTIQLIGMIKRFCKKHKVELILQQASAKRIGYKFAGVAPQSDHRKSHKWDAVAHGVYYLQRKGVREPRVHN